LRQGLNSPIGDTWDSLVRSVEVASWPVTVVSLRPYRRYRTPLGARSAI